jgi:hypothetical protein
MGSFGFAGVAHAEDGENAEAAIGIIGQVIGGAIEAEAEKDAAHEQERRCRRLARKCDDGEGWACEKQDEECGY